MDQSPRKSDERKISTTSADHGNNPDNQPPPNPQEATPVEGISSTSESNANENNSALEQEQKLPENQEAVLVLDDIEEEEISKFNITASFDIDASTSQDFDRENLDTSSDVSFSITIVKYVDDFVEEGSITSSNTNLFSSADKLLKPPMLSIITSSSSSKLSRSLDGEKPSTCVTSSTEELSKTRQSQKTSPSSDANASSSTEELLKIFGGARPTTSSDANLSSSTEELSKILDDRSSSTEELSKILDKDTPTASSDSNPSSSTEELTQILEGKRSSASLELNPSSSAEGLSNILEDEGSSTSLSVKPSSLPELPRGQAKGRATALPESISSTPEADKICTSSDDLSSVDENLSERKETRTLPPFLKKNYRKYPEMWKYRKPIPKKMTDIPTTAASNNNSPRATFLGRPHPPPKLDESVTSSKPGMKPVDNSQRGSKRKGPVTRILYTPFNKCRTCGTDAGYPRPPLIIIRYRKKTAAEKKNLVQTSVNSQSSKTDNNLRNSKPSITTEKKKEQNEKKKEINGGQVKHKEETPKKTEKQLKYEIINQQVLEFFNKLQDYAEEEVQEPMARINENQEEDKKDEDDIFKMENLD